MLQPGTTHGSNPRGATYQVRQRVMAIGDDFWVEDRSGARTFLVDGTAVPLSRRLSLRDPGGAELYRIQERQVRVRDTMEIESDAETVATVRKALVTPLRERFDVALASGASWTAEGRILDYEYRVDGLDGRIAEVSKKWFGVGETYGIEVVPGVDAALMVMVAIAIDQLARPAS